MPEPYQVPLPQDKQAKGKLSFLERTFCAVCGAKGGATRSYYVDPISQRRVAGFLCGDCFSVVSEAEAEHEEPEPSEAEPPAA